jgi:2-polyprenyl-6-methoxyphenol hydroxylase-like FAD-dependent oxidoreductase
VPTIFDAIRRAQPLSPIKTHRATENRRRRYDRAKELPHNFLVLGDAVCAFNPVYGQGMTVAALGAVTLDKILSERRRRYPNGSLVGLARDFQKRLAKVNDTPWMLSTAQDLRYRECTGASPSRMTRFMHRYMDRVIELATRKVAVRRILLRTFNMLTPPSTLFQPRVLFQVLVQVLKPVRTHLVENPENLLFIPQPKRS